MTKELIVLCDGTGDSPELPNANWTNVVLIRNILGAGFAGKTKMHANIREGWEIDVFHVQNTMRVIYYDRGVGAPILDPNGDMAQWSWNPMDFFKNAKYIYHKFKAYDEKINANGIIDNVSQAYYFLSRNFEPGDQIYLFGFSRGAYTLRILLDLISYIGLIDRAKFSDEQSLKAAITMGLSLYKTAINPNENPLLNEFRLNCHPHENIVHFLGLWDTVKGLVAEKVPQDNKLTSVVKIARHALAIDEQRAIFKPELWLANQNIDAKQVWFSGVHSDIGGGYEDRGLANITLQWMLDEAVDSGLIINREFLLSDAYKPDPLATQFDSLNAKVKSDVGITWKAIGGIYRRPVAQTALNESLHPTVLYRYGQAVKQNDKLILYRPSNLTHTLVALNNGLKNCEGIDSSIVPKSNIPDADELSDFGEDDALIKLNCEKLGCA